MTYIENNLTSFLYTNATNPTTAYDPETTYNVEEEARIGSKIYKSVNDNNLDNYPTDTLYKWWYEWDVANDYAILDLFEESATQFIADGIVEFERENRDTLAIGNFNATSITIEYLDDINGIVEGMTIATSVDLSSTVTQGYGYVDSTRVDLEDTAKTFTASKDTYVDIDTDGTLVYIEVTNGAGAPAISGTNERLAKVVTDADNITSVEDLRTVIDPVLDTETYTFNAFSNMYNPYLYIYGGFEYDPTKTVYQSIKRTGAKIRVTFSCDGGSVYCGFLVAGNSVDMGDTLNKVIFKDNKYGKILKREASFSTIMDRNKLMKNLAKAKENYDNALPFILDPSEDSDFNNMVVIAKIKDYGGTAEVATKNQMQWVLEQNVQE